MESNDTPSTPHIRLSKHVHFNSTPSQVQPSSPQRPESPIAKPIASHSHHTRLAAALYLRETKSLMDILTNSQDYDTNEAPVLPKSTPSKKARSKNCPKNPARATKNRSRNSKRPAPTPVPAPTPQILEDLNTREETFVISIDNSIPLVHIPFDTLGLMVRFRPTRHYIRKNTARNIKKIIHRLILQLQSLDQRGLLASDESTLLVKTVFLTHFIILGFHVDKEKSPFKISQELLDNDNWEDYCVGSYQLREVHETAGTAQKRKDQQKKWCEKLIKQLHPRKVHPNPKRP
jgi:hypothetical protein